MNEDVIRFLESCYEDDIQPLIDDIRKLESSSNPKSWLYQIGNVDYYITVVDRKVVDVTRNTNYSGGSIWNEL